MLTLDWTRGTPDGDFHHSLAYKFADPLNAIASPVVLGRLIGHLVLDELPDAALPEILDHLGNIWAFYHTKHQHDDSGTTSNPQS